MRAVVAGGAGFLGGHLCSRLLRDGIEVVCIDDLSTGRILNTLGENMDFLNKDISNEHGVHVPGSVDMVFNLASPASPPAYQKRPIPTLRAGSIGTMNLLDLAFEKNASFLQASTSEVYGDPLEHPQAEDYWGNVNPIGPRSMYDEAKRFGEAACMAYAKSGLRVRIARIFNTYGPGMDPMDGRAVPTFIHQGLASQRITVHGTGQQTRSLCYVDDMIEGLIRRMNHNSPIPINLGSDQEVTVMTIAQHVKRLTRSQSPVILVEPDEDDPQQRRPDLMRAKTLLGWEATTGLIEGLAKTIAYERGMQRW